jgi:hypothetical protein
MIRINVQYFYKLASSLIPLREIKADILITDQFGILYGAEKELEFFLWNPLLPPGTSFSCGKQLYDVIQALTNNLSRDEPVNYFEAIAITNSLHLFETVLAAEFALKDTFVVSKKSIYSTTDLIERAEEMFSSAVRDLMPDIVRDIHDAGKCMAFELPTAAAFHLYRATEAAAKHYITRVRGTPPTEKEKRFGLGGYAKIMIGLKVDERISNSVSQLTKLHRNPAIHPDHHISTDEVISILGIVQSVIQVMALDMNRLDNAPEMTLLDILPDNSLFKYPGEEDDSSDGVRSSDENDTLRLEAGATETA